MPELRLNMLTREWVIVQSERAKKPEDFRQWKEKRYRPDYLDSCPFCKGNESKTPDDIMRVPESGDWKIRVTKNKYSVLAEEGDRTRYNQGLKHYVSGVGKHEVVIETPRHDLSLGTMPVQDIRDVINVYRERFTESFVDRRIQHVIIYKNHGINSGTTIMHSHAQIIGMPVMPMQIRNRVEEAMRYFDNTGECLICATTADELKDGRRIIHESKNYMSFIPYAALSPFHIWLFPKSHQQSFSSITPDDAEDLADTLKITLGKVYSGLNDPDYNLVIRSLSPYRSRSEYIHWYMSIVPHVASTSGFELGTGMYVNTTLPEHAAEYLRNTKIDGL